MYDYIEFQPTSHAAAVKGFIHMFLPKFRTYFSACFHWRRPGAAIFFAACSVLSFLSSAPANPFWLNENLYPASNQQFRAYRVNSQNSVRLAGDQLTAGSEHILVTPHTNSIPSEFSLLEELPCYRSRLDTWMVPTDQLLVRFVDGTPARIQEALLAKADTRLAKTFPQGTVSVTVPQGSDPLTVARALNSLPEVSWAHPDYIRPARPRFLPNDTHLTNQWYLHNTGQFGGLYNRDINIERAWDQTTGSNSIVVAILDDGFQVTHPDLAPKVFVNPGESGSGKESNQVDDDLNGYVDDWQGWSMVSDTNVTIPIFTADRHGTASAGIVAAATDNGMGVAGVAPDCMFLPIRIVSGNTIQDSDLVEGILYAAAMADVINIGYFMNPIPSVYDALRYATIRGRNEQGCVILAALGNDGVLRRFASDAATAPEVLTVTGNSNYDKKASLADYGNPADFSAPAGGGSYRISTTDRMGTDGYESGDYALNSFEGTSPACAIAAGAAALLLSSHPDWTPLQVGRAIKETADKVNSIAEPYNDAGRNDYLGFGRLNLHNALQYQPGTWDQYEPDSSIAQASNIFDGQLQYRSMTDEFDSDWATFTIHTTSHIRVSGVGSSNLFLTLLDAATNVILSDQGFPAYSYVETNGLPAGKYYAALTPWNTTGVSYYAIHFGIQNLLDNYENDDSTGTAQVIERRDMQYRTLYPSGDVDTAVFELTNTVTVDIWTFGEWNGWLHNTLWKDGMMIASNYTQSPATHISTQLTAGTYYVQIEDHEGYEVSAYQLLLEIREPDDQEPDGTTNTASFITDGTRSFHSLFPTGDVDWFTFTLTNSSSILVMTDSLNPLLPLDERDTYMTLFDADLSILASDNDGNNGRFSAIYQEGLAPGTYYVEVKGFEPTTVCPNYFMSLDVYDAAPRIVTESPPGTNVTFSWQADSLFDYIVEYTTSVSDAAWAVATNLEGTIGTMQWTDDGSATSPGPSSTPSRVYRIRTQN